MLKQISSALLYDLYSHVFLWEQCFFFLKTLLSLMAMFQPQCCLLGKVLGTERVNFRSGKLQPGQPGRILMINFLHCAKNAPAWQIWLGLCVKKSGKYSFCGPVL